MLSRVVDSAVYHGTRLLAPRLSAHRVALPPGAAFASFSFDDFPRSAATLGAPILEERGVRGTYYVAMRLLGDAGGFDRAELERVAGAGHELGCHTHHHLDCFPEDDESVLDDVAQNAEALAGILPGVVLKQFAFPFGRLRPAQKSLLGARFESLRSIFPGTHAEEVDLRLVRANKLFSPGGFANRALSLIDDVARRGGWVVFFTHDISDDPSPFGTRPADLARAVSRALDLGVEVLPVGEVVARLR